MMDEGSLACQLRVIASIKLDFVPDESKVPSYKIKLKARKSLIGILFCAHLVIQNLLIIMSPSEAYSDVVELCALLQCLGFSVKSLDTSDANASQPEAGTRTVVINCQASGLHVVLETPSANCSCPTANEHQNSGLWQVSGNIGGKQLDKEFGCSLLGSLPKSHRDRLTQQLHDIIRCIKQNYEVDPGKLKEDKSASMTELKTPEKCIFELKPETPGHYRSLDTLTGRKETQQQLPALRPLQRAHHVSESSGDEKSIFEGEKKKSKCERQSTFTLPSPPPSQSGSIRRRNKTSSPIHGPPNNMLESLVAAKKRAEDLCDDLSDVINEYMDRYKNDDSSLNSLALDVSKISVLKVPESMPQFASSPNLSEIMATDNFTKSRLKRFESASTSNLAKEGKLAKLRRISPNIFKRKEMKESLTVKTDKTPKSQDSKIKFNSLIKPRLLTPLRNKPSPTPESSPNPSSASKKKFSHIKSTIPRPAK